MHIVMIIVAYLLGAIPFGLLIGKMKGVDVRQYGSGNIGTTNVGRVLGKKAAIFTLLGDGLKGLLPVLIARVFVKEDVWLAATGIAAVVGHNWPIYLKFKGGKGVTTTYGAFLGLAWLPALATIVTWVVVSKLTQKASVAALLSAPCAPIFAYIAGILYSGVSLPVIVFALITCVMIYLRHIENINRLLAGTESRSDQPISAESKES